MPLFDESFLRTLEYLNVAARRLLAGHEHADRESQRRGGTVEFADYRSYSLGDDPRYIDWNVYARHGTLFVKEFAAEENLHVLLLLDASASMAAGASGKRWDFARRLAAALGYIGLANFDRVSLVPFSGELAAGRLHLRGKTQIFPLLDLLEKTSAAGTTDMGRCLAGPFPASLGKTVAIVITDLYDRAGYAAGLRRLVEKRFEVHVLHVLQAEEIRPDWEGPTRLVDAETGRMREVTLDPGLRERYIEALNRYLDEVEQFCRVHEIGYVRLLAEMPLERAVVDLLQRKGVLRS